MARKIQMKRGLESDLPRLDIGEPGFTTDTEKFFVGGNTGNVEIVKMGDISGLANRVDGHDTDIANTNALLADKASQSALNTTNSNVSANTTAIAAKADKSYVDTQLSNIGNASPKGTYATLSALQTAFPTGTTGVYIVTADGKWYYWNGSAWTAGGTYQSTGIADKSVDPLKTTFILLGKNLFDKFNQISGKLYSYSTGSLVDSASYTTMANYVPIEASTTYIRSGADTIIVFFDANKTYISGVAAGRTSFTTPANAAYMRASVDNPGLSVAQIEKGSTATAYEAFNYSLSGVNYKIPSASVGASELKLASITADKISFPLPTFQKSKNLFNKATITAGYFVNQTSGNLDANASHNSSDFIPVSASTQYSFITDPSFRIAYYDSNQAFISGALAPTSPITTPANCAFVRFSMPTNMGVDSQQFEQGASNTSYAAYGFTSSNLLSSGNSAISRIINLPPKLYGLVGQELNIYFDNIIEGKDTEYTFDVVCGKGQQFENFWRFVPTVAESLAITINVYKDNNLVASGSSTIKVSGTSVGSGVTKKVIVIGDSTTDSGIAVTKLNDNFNTDVMDISTLGTRGTSPNKHEGRSGWRAFDYVSSASVSGVTNSFWNPNTSSFDFGYYMTTFGLSVPDYVIINLGINDMFSYTDDASLNTEITNVFARYTTMINSIKAYNSSIKIGIAVTIPPNYSQDAFGKAYGSGQTRARYKRNNLLWVNQLISTYKNREAENLYLIPIYTNLDTRYNMGTEQTQVNARNTLTYTSPIGNGGVHPVTEGYWQVADVYWYFLKSFEV